MKAMDRWNTPLRRTTAALVGMLLCAAVCLAQPQTGKVMVEDGNFLAAPSDGQFLPRKIPDAVRSRPAV